MTFNDINNHKINSNNDPKSESESESLLNLSNQFENLFNVCKKPEKPKPKPKKVTFEAEKTPIRPKNN